MIDRQPSKPGRIKLTNEATGAVTYYVMERADEPTEVGTPLNRATLFDSSAESRSGASTPSDAFNNMMKESTITLQLGAWSTSASNGYYTQQVNVSWMKSQYSPLYDLIITSAALSGYESGAFALIDKMETYNGYVKFYATAVPEVALNVRIKGV